MLEHNLNSLNQQSQSSGDFFEVVRIFAYLADKTLKIWIVEHLMAKNPFGFLGPYKGLIEIEFGSTRMNS